MSNSSIEKINGFFVIDKPRGLTSHDVVQAARRRLKTSRVGHLGTLDPLATGVLPLAVGKATRLVQFLSGGTKIYQGTIHLGFSTDTFDEDGRATSPRINPVVTPQQLQKISHEMLGDQLQTPPPYSAKKVDGVRSYTLARQGVQPSLTPQRISIWRLDLSQRGTCDLDFEIHCSAGSYVRSVAHEIGQRLGCGAHLTCLRRTVSGEFLITQAVSLDLLFSVDESELSFHLISMNAALHKLPELRVSKEIEMRVACGMEFSVDSKPSVNEPVWFRIVSPTGELLGVAERSKGPLVQEDMNPLLPRFHPRVVL